MTLIVSDLGDSERRFSEPNLSGRHVYLRAVLPEDLRSIRMIDLSAELGVRFRHRGATPGMAQWTQSSDSALAQFLIVRSDDNRPIGLAAIYEPSFQDQYAHFAAAMFGKAGRSPLAVMGCVLAIEYAFKCWAFRKLYLELPAYNLDQISAGLGRMFVEEGRLREHMYYDGHWWDKVVLALYRNTWEERSARLVKAALPPPSRQAKVTLAPQP